MPPANTTYTGAIHGPGSLTKSGTATLTLSATSDYSGTTTITGGGLCVNGALGAESPVTLQNSGLVCGGGTIGGDVTASGGSIALSAGGLILGAVNVASGTLTVGKAGAGSYLTTSGGVNVTGGGVLLVSPSAMIVGSVNFSSSAESNFSGMISGSNSLLALDAPSGGTMTLSNTASSTYGGVVIQAGTLKIASTAALGNNPLTVNGGMLDLGGWTSFTLTSLAGSGGMIGTSSGTSTLVVEASSGTTNYSGSIVDGGGLVSLVKAGAGTLILSGSDSYTGGTSVSAGILQIASKTVSGRRQFAFRRRRLRLHLRPVRGASDFRRVARRAAVGRGRRSRARHFRIDVCGPMECGDLSPLFTRSVGVPPAQGIRHSPCAVRPACISRRTDFNPLERNEFRSTKGTAAGRGDQSGNKFPHSKFTLRRIGE